METSSTKLKELRALMDEHKVHAYIVPHTDPHMTEYVPVSDEWVAFISGFTGSSGLCVVTKNEALCWTDSRYFLQCEKQLEEGWQMRKMLKGEPTWFEWIASNLKAGEICAYDPLLVTIDTADARGKFLTEKGLVFKPLNENLVGKVWTNRPPIPQTKLYILDDSYAGESAKQKLQNIGKEVKANGAVNYLVTDLCEIAWTLNLRANDAECTPLFISYLWLSYEFAGDAINNSGILFIHEDKVPQDVRDYLKGINITIKPYDGVREAVSGTETKTYVNRAGVNAAVYQSIKDQSVIIGKNRSIIEHLKGIKNAREIKGFTDCHVRDGAAVVRYLAWLDHSLNVEGKTDITEYSGAQKLNSLRHEQKLNKGLSFPAISSIGSNGAIVHYKPEEKTAAVLNNKEVYLLDSGGQYTDGTTDTTRTTHFGKPTDEERDAFTRVLLGNLDVERVLIPNNGTYSGADVDVLARRHLWAKGMDFGHGTGHGVGYFLNVHEGPHGISKYRTEPFLEGMVVTNEPGYYKAGSFGMRTENILIVEKRCEGKFLGFENVTLVPYELALIDNNLLSKADADFINTYHERVYNSLLPLLEEQQDKIAVEYLKRKTAKITL